MTKEAIGLYLHIPYCRSKCPYCDFCSFPRPTEAALYAYTDELIRRVREAGERLERPVDTVYLGGGTPTLLPPDCLSQLLSAVRESFSVLPDAEITAEGNPAAAPEAVLEALAKGGVNRLSLGAQSAHEQELFALGRLHRWPDVERTVAAARALGITNINLDFMLGIPHQTAASLDETLTRALALEPDHLSAYTLMLEDGTPFARRGRAVLGLPSDPDEADDLAISLWEIAAARLTAAGYEHYEISNFACPDKRSRHNLHTWQCREYLGLGPGAHSYLDGVRFGMSRDLEGFLRGEDITAFRTLVTPADAEGEYIMLGLRLSDGIDEREFRRRFGHGFADTRAGALAPLVAAGYVESDARSTRLTEKGFPVSNAIIASLM